VGASSSSSSAAPATEAHINRAADGFERELKLRLGAWQKVVRAVGSANAADEESNKAAFARVMASSPGILVTVGTFCAWRFP